MSKAIIIVTCSKCWNDVTLRDLNIEPNYPYSGECTHCMVTLDARVETEDNDGRLD